MIKRIILLSLFSSFTLISFSQKDTLIRKKERKQDILLLTTMGDIVLRLSDSTPLHRDNFLKLVKKGFYDSLLFHRVMKEFMIQGGDPNSKKAVAGQSIGNGGPGYTIPAEFRKSFFHKKGMLAAARQPDQVNPAKASNGSQFYIVVGKIFTDPGLDSTEIYRLNGRKIPVEHREVYKTIGGTPHLDQSYTVFGNVVSGLDVVENISKVVTNNQNRPQVDIMILKATLIKRKRSKK